MKFVQNTATRFLPLLLLPFIGMTQPTLEFANGSGPSSSGPTISSQVITFQNNALNPLSNAFSAFSPTVTATFSLSSQQYTLPAGQSASGAGLTFGGTVSTSGQAMSNSGLFTAMSALSSPANNNFSSSPVAAAAGTGISTTANYAVEIFNSAMGLYNAGVSTSGTYYMANLTVTFNKPISNPVLQIVGLGGTFGPGGPSALGLTTQLTLTTPGHTLSKLSGSSELSVTATQISNNDSHPTATTGSGAASGSVLVTGSNITSLTFKVSLRGDGAVATWSNAGQHTGDAFLIGVSSLSTNVVLPVTLSAFGAQRQNSSSLLEWTTAKEANSAHFDVQRRDETGSWETIGQVHAAGNSASATDYQYVDASPAAGMNYYRIVEIDLDGASTYSRVVSLSFAQQTSLALFPNPAVSQITLTTGDASPRSAQLFSFSGSLLASIPSLGSGQSIDISRYPRGMYLLILRDAAGASETKKFEKL